MRPYTYYIIRHIYIYMQFYPPLQGCQGCKSVRASTPERTTTMTPRGRCRQQRRCNVYSPRWLCSARCCRRRHIAVELYPAQSSPRKTLPVYYVYTFRAFFFAHFNFTPTPPCSTRETPRLCCGASLGKFIRTPWLDRREKNNAKVTDATSSCIILYAPVHLDWCYRTLVRETFTESSQNIYTFSSEIHSLSVWRWLNQARIRNAQYS